MRTRIDKLTGHALDWAVAVVVFMDYEWQDGVPDVWKTSRGIEIHTPSDEVFSPSTNYAQAGPILCDQRICRTVDHSGLWIAYWTSGYIEGDNGKSGMQCDKSEILAGLRCVVALSFGEFIDIPDELVEVHK